MNTTTLGRDPAWLTPGASRALPFAVFIALMVSEPWLGRQLDGLLDPLWWYGLRSLLVAGLIVFFWRRYDELAGAGQQNAGDVALAVATGLVVLLLWLLLDDGFFVLAEPQAGFVPLATDGELDWPPLLMRLAGSALLVPVMEELFWRSLVMRWLENVHFVTVDAASVGLLALLLSSLVFGFEHNQWAAGILAGLAYGGLYRRCRNLWPAVIAHAVTNAGLGLWVLATGAWHFL